MNDKREIKVKEIINEKDLEKQYSLIFDYICDFLDNDLENNNYCDFQNGRCVANRLGKSVHKDNGCCYYYKVGLCNHLKNGVCTSANIACKLFMCEYLETKRIKYDLNSILDIKLFFNRKQIEIIKHNYFKSKDEVINMLMKYRTKRK